MASREKTAFKERLKHLKDVKHIKYVAETIEEKIDVLRSQIKNCTQDLVNFPDNAAIENKLATMNKRLEILKNERNNN